MDLVILGAVEPVQSLGPHQGPGVPACHPPAAGRGARGETRAVGVSVWGLKNPCVYELRLCMRYILIWSFQHPLRE